MTLLGILAYDGTYRCPAHIDVSSYRRETHSGDGNATCVYCKSPVAPSPQALKMAKAAIEAGQGLVAELNAKIKAGDDAVEALEKKVALYDRRALNCTTAFHQGKNYTLKAAAQSELTGARGGVELLEAMRSGHEKTLAHLEAVVADIHRVMEAQTRELLSMAVGMPKTPRGLFALAVLTELGGDIADRQDRRAAIELVQEILDRIGEVPVLRPGDMVEHRARIASVGFRGKVGLDYRLEEGAVQVSVTWEHTGETAWHRTDQLLLTGDARELIAA